MITGITASSILKDTGFIFDKYPAAFVFSLFKLKYSATKTIEVRRSSDNALTDVLLKESGSLDLNSLVSSGGTLGAWVGSNSAFVRRCYNQGSIDFDILQSTNSLQPRIIEAGVLEVKNLNAAINMLTSSTKFESSSALSALNNGSSFTIYTVSANRTTESFGGLLCTTNNSGGQRMVIFKDSRTSPNRNCLLETSSGVFAANLSTPRVTTDQVLQIVSSSGTAISSWDNNATGDQNVAFTGSYNNDLLIVGSQHVNQSFLDGTIQEIIIRDIKDTDVVRNEIRDNINLRYSIY